MDKINLKKILDSFNGSETELYNLVNFLDIPSHKFNGADYCKLLYKSMYKFHERNGIENILKYQVPISIGRDVSYSEFKQYLYKLQEYEIKIDLLPNVANHFDNICRIAAIKLLGAGDWCWTRIYSSKITGQDIEEFGKMYLSVDNKDLYRFACLLLEKCIETGLEDYEYKVNNDENVTRSDNVVIFFTKDNFNKYISLINQILAENPDIKLNQQNVLAYSIDDNIKVARDYNDGSVSYTSKVCQKIMLLKEKEYDNEQIVELIAGDTKKYVSDIFDLAKENKYKKR